MSSRVVHMTAVAGIEATRGVTHAGNAGDPVAGGALQHMAFERGMMEEKLKRNENIFLTYYHNF